MDALTRGMVTRVSYWPEGADPHDPDDPNVSDFRVDVEWCGPRQDGPRPIGGYRVTTRHGSSELSRGGTWTFYVPRFRRWQHRWATLEEACAAAEKVVDDVKVNMRTWAEWQARFAERKAAE